jgi:hypothetical protein
MKPAIPFTMSPTILPFQDLPYHGCLVDAAPCHGSLRRTVREESPCFTVSPSPRLPSSTAQPRQFLIADSFGSPRPDLPGDEHRLCADVVDGSRRPSTCLVPQAIRRLRPTLPWPLSSCLDPKLKPSPISLRLFPATLGFQKDIIDNNAALNQTWPVFRGRRGPS